MREERIAKIYTAAFYSIELSYNVVSNFTKSNIFLCMVWSCESFEDVMIFTLCCFYKGSLLLAIRMSWVYWKYCSVFQRKRFIPSAFVSANLLMWLCNYVSAPKMLNQLLRKVFFSKWCFHKGSEFFDENAISIRSGLLRRLKADVFKNASS